MGSRSLASSTSGPVAGRPDTPPIPLHQHTLRSIRAEIFEQEQRVYDLEVDLTAAREYLQALHRRHGELLLEAAMDQDGAAQ